MKINFIKIIGIFLITFSCCSIPSTHAFVDDHNNSHKTHKENDLSQENSCSPGKIDLNSKIFTKEKNCLKISPTRFENERRSNFETNEKVTKKSQNTYFDLNINRLKRE